MSAKKNVEHLLSRRETLGILGAAGVTVLVAGCGGDSNSAVSTGTPTRTGLATSTPGALATSTPTRAATGTATKATQTPAQVTETPTPTSTPSELSCVVKPSLTEGPFFVDEMLNRSDLTTDTTEAAVLDALPLRLKIGVYRVSGETCIPLEGAQVDIWHASSEGVYSDEASGSIQSKNTLGETYLRGYQLADADGLVEFVTIYPGWYQGRTAHIHFKVRMHSAVGALTYEFTSQVFFADSISDSVYAVAPYNARGTRTVRNSNDGIFDEELLLDLTSTSNGFDASFTIGLQI